MTDHSDALDGLETLRKACLPEMMTQDDLCGYLETLDRQGQARVLDEVSDAHNRVASHTDPKEPL